MELYIREVGQYDKKSGKVHWTLVDVFNKSGLMEMYLKYEPYVDYYCENKNLYYQEKERLLNSHIEYFLQQSKRYAIPSPYYYDDYKRTAHEYTCQKQGFEGKRNNIYRHKFTIYFSENLIRFRRITVNDTNTNNTVEVINFDELFNEKGEMTL